MNLLAVAVEIGPKQTFATALDWPGWCRKAKGGEAEALEALLGHTERYREVVTRAGLTLPRELLPEVVERLPGGGATDFGVPGVPAAAESAPLTAAEAERRASLLAAAWAIFDEVAAAAPEELRKGPRGGGRDTSRVRAHVIEAEQQYARNMGLRLPYFEVDDTESLAVLRAAEIELLRRPATGGALKAKSWTARFATRYMIWHVLDHAWEIEDRSV